MAHSPFPHLPSQKAEGQPYGQETRVSENEDRVFDKWQLYLFTTTGKGSGNACSFIVGESIMASCPRPPSPYHPLPTSLMFTTIGWFSLTRLARHCCPRCRRSCRGCRWRACWAAADSSRRLRRRRPSPWTSPWSDPWRRGAAGSSPTRGPAALRDGACSTPRTPLVGAPSRRRRRFALLLGDVVTPGASSAVSAPSSSKNGQKAKRARVASTTHSNIIMPTPAYGTEDFEPRPAFRCVPRAPSRERGIFWKFGDVN